MGRLVLPFVAPGAGVIVGGLALGQLGGPVVAQGFDGHRRGDLVLAVGVAEQLAAAVPGALPIGLGARRGAGGLHLRHGGELVPQGLNDLLLRYGRSADGTKRRVGHALFGAGSGLARFDLGFVGGRALLCFAAFVCAGIPVLFIIPGPIGAPAVGVRVDRDRQRFQAGFVLAVGVAEQLAAAIPGALPIGLGARRCAGGGPGIMVDQVVAQGGSHICM